MRILVWSELFWPYIGGAELFVARLMLELRERGHEFLVVTSHDYLPLPGEDDYHGIPVHRFPFRAAIGGPDLALLRDAEDRVSSVVHEFSPDLVHVNAVGPTLFPYLRTSDAGLAPWILRLQTEVPAGRAGGGETLLHRAMVSADWVVAISETVLAQARRLAPAITTRSSTIRNGLQPAVARRAPPPDGQRLLCLGRLVPAKGFDLALTAFAGLARRFPELRMTLAGDGVARRDLEEQAARLGVETAVDFVGWVDPERVPDLIDAANVVLVPSRREGLGLVAAQAASRAREVVTSRAGGLPEIVVDGASGLVVEPNDAEGLAHAVGFLIERPDEAARMGRAARSRVQELLSLPRSVDAYDALYRTVTGRYASSR